ncbi:glycosyltransferase [Photobacterium swingsii]|uniref:glycosyltransferase n=1 Tax=Photobacterium swingsii TaxID=680026 RepID=UPI00352FDCF3
MKNIAIVAPTFPVLSETFIRTEVESIQECGYQVMVFTFQKNTIENTPTNKQKMMYPVKKIGETFYLSFLTTLSFDKIKKCWQFINEQQSLPKRSLFFHSLKLASQLVEANIHHVHAHFSQHTAAHAIAAAKLAGITVSFVGHGHDVNETPFDIATKIKHADLVIAVCHYMADKFNHAYQGNIRVLHCGVKTALFTPQLRPISPQLKFVFVGRLIESKGLTYLLSSLKPLINQYSFSLDIIGDGELADTLKQQAHELGLSGHINFIGAKTHAWIVKHLPYYDCLVAPFCVAQSGSVDTGPLVLKEAMSVGVPVITSDLSGCKEIVTAATGYIVEQKNVEQLSRAIAQFISLAPNERLVMGMAARKKVKESFDAHKQALTLCQWIEDLPQSPPPSSFSTPRYSHE